MQAIAKRATAEVEKEQQAAAKRMKQANGNGGKATGNTFALLAFETAWEPADLHALVTQAEGTTAASANGAAGGGKKRGKRKTGTAGR